MAHLNDIAFKPDWDLPNSGPVVPAPRVLPPPAPDQGFPIVIAEDDPVSRKLVTTIIELEGYRTIVTRDGAEAMNAIRAQKGPCVAVIDWMMPGIDGAEICRRVRESGRSVYIIMVTARSSQADAVLGLDEGADDYMVKPYHRRELLAHIRTGFRQLHVQLTLEKRVEALEAAAGRGNNTLKMDMPL